MSVIILVNYGAYIRLAAPTMPWFTNEYMIRQERAIEVDGCAYVFILLTPISGQYPALVDLA